MISSKLYNRFYSDPKYNGTLAFYQWIRQSVEPSHRILNCGAGPPTNEPLRCFRGDVKEVVGVDVDPIVLDNSEVDRALLIQNGRIPVDDAYFDVAYSDFVLEHVDKPREFLVEVHRLLKPGGCFFFRTPNMFHYVTAISALTHHSFHERVANPMRGLSEDSHEPWPTHYRMNTRAKLRKLAAGCQFADVELKMIEPEPSYLKFHAFPFVLGVAYERFVNSSALFEGIRVNILGRFRKANPGIL